MDITIITIEPMAQDAVLASPAFGEPDFLASPLQDTLALSACEMPKAVARPAACRMRPAASLLGLDTLQAVQSASLLLANFFCQARQLSSHVIRAQVHVRALGTRGPVGIIPCLHGFQAFEPAPAAH